MRRIGEPCSFCGAEALARCEWPVPRFVVVCYDDLKVGDRVRRNIDRLQRRAPARVLELAPYRVPGALLDAGLQVTLGIRGKSKTVIVLQESRVQVEREQPCLNAVCENCLRRVEDGVEYCRDHWNSWQAVA